MHKADNATSPAESQRLFKAGLKLFSPEAPGTQTASALLPSVPQGAGKLGRASPQPGVEAKRGGFKPAQAQLSPGSDAAPVPGPCSLLWGRAVPGSSSSTAFRNVLCCFNPSSFPNLLWSRARGIVKPAPASPASEGTLWLCQEPARSWAQPRAHHPSRDPAASPLRCHWTKTTSVQSSSCSRGV